MRRFPLASSDGLRPTTRVRDFEVRLPGRGLRCDCGYRLDVHDFDVVEPCHVRAICSRCHADLLIIGRTEIPVWSDVGRRKQTRRRSTEQTR
jgi:hypothetical protein